MDYVTKEKFDDDPGKFLRVELNVKGILRV